MEAATVARLFSPTVFNQLARVGRSSIFSRLARSLAFPERILATGSVADAFDHAFSVLKRKAFRHEYVYKSALTHKILLGTHSLRSASMLTEFRAGHCKADVVILNGAGTVYEIKSERDSLNRIEKQVAAFRELFPLVNVIAGENHIADIKEKMPRDVGVLALSERYHISPVRKARANYTQLSSLAIFESLSMREAEYVLADLGIATIDVPNTRRYPLLKEEFAKCDAKAVHLSMVGVLKRTRSLAPLSDLVADLPRSLQCLAVSTRIRKQDHPRLVATMQTPVAQALLWDS